MRQFLATAAIALLALPVHAVGSDDDAPPAQTETTTTCEEGLIWDPETETCVAPRDSRLDREGLYTAARELAYAGRIDDAEAVLDAMADNGATDVLTYRGFIARSRGDWPEAERYYTQALLRDPDNTLARSYYGQGLAKQGDVAAARDQLSEIRARGGRNTWAEAALMIVLSGGNAPAY